MTDETPIANDGATEPDIDADETRQADPDGDQDARLTPTQNMRRRPSALDLKRAFD
jgi:hypothetical protein